MEDLTKKDLKEKPTMASEKVASKISPLGRSP